MGKRSNKARSLTEEEKELLREADKFGSKNSRSAYSLYVVAFDAVLWSPRPSRTPRNENGRFSTLQKRQRHGVRAVHWRSNEDQTGRTAEQEQRFSVTYVLCWRRKVSGCSLQAASEDHETCDGLVLSTSVSKETKDWMTTSGSKLNRWAKTVLLPTWWKRLWRVLVLKKVTKIHESQCKKDNNQQVQESKRWTLRYCQSHRPQKRTVPWRLRWSRPGRPTTTLYCNIQTKLWKPRHWEKANGSFRHHNNCGNTRAGKQECARTTHISRPIDDSVERKPVLAINCRFQAQNFLRESNHDEVLGTDHDEHVQQLLSVSHHWPIEANSWDFKTAAQFL